jgi:ribosome maturation factor RimP
MEWRNWIGKNVFIRTRHGKVYSGIIKDIDDNSLPLIWIILIDKYGNLVQLTSSEIVEIKEEKRDG